ncbi:MAG: gliding motility-associated C-terminal domain-containing protein [Bacteroidota bacterium]
MMIFNRWGNMIFRTTTWGEAWNGTKNNKGTFDDIIMDVYVYRIKAKEIDGPKHDYIGHVTLMP